MDSMAAMKRYGIMYQGYINAILMSGDGKTSKTAYVVVKVSDEYKLLKQLKLKSVRQSLISNEFGTFDLMSIKESNKNKDKIKEIYFNIDKPFGALSNMFKNTD
ncbi:MAG: hypothetical protein ACI9JN_001715 [Bacteroidia bacterium]|jgi:hypothetical protein